MDIVTDLMKQAATGDNLAAMSSSVGGDPGAVRSALGMSLPVVMGSMAAAAAKPGGAEMLNTMISPAGSTSPLGTMSGFLGGTAAPGGSSLVSTLFGSQLAPVQDAIARKTGLPPAVVGKVLEIAVPMVIASVGKIAAGQNLDAAGLAGLLSDQSKMALAGSPDAAAVVEKMVVSPATGGLSGMMKNMLG